MDILSFWDRVKNLIKANKTSLQKTSVSIEVPYNTLRNWVYYSRIPDVETACDLAKTLNVSVEFLVYGRDRNIKEEYLAYLKERKEATAKITKLAGEITEQCLGI